MRWSGRDDNGIEWLTKLSPITRSLHKNKLVKNVFKAFNNDNNIFTLAFATFCIFILFSTFSLPNIYININLKKVIKLILEFFV